MSAASGEAALVLGGPDAAALPGSLTGAVSITWTPTPQPRVAFDHVKNALI